MYDPQYWVKQDRPCGFEKGVRPYTISGGFVKCFTVKSNYQTNFQPVPEPPEDWYVYSVDTNTDVTVECGVRLWTYDLNRQLYANWDISQRYCIFKIVLGMFVSAYCWFSVCCQYYFSFNETSL